MFFSQLRSKLLHNIYKRLTVQSFTNQAKQYLNNNAQYDNTKIYYSTSLDVQKNFDIVIVGAGIIGLGTALELKIRYPSCSICVLEKESLVCSHQSGNNSGVIHAGIYYKPNSLRAALCVSGVEYMYNYCECNNIPYKRNGKLIVAVKHKELKWLDDLLVRGCANNVPGLEILEPKQYNEIQPGCGGLRALWSPNTGIVEFAEVGRHFASTFRCLGGIIEYNFEVTSFKMGAEGSDVQCGSDEGQRYPIVLTSSNYKIKRAGFVLTCCGLQADRVAMLSGESSNPKVVPFRGEYFLLNPELQECIKTNIYPVPDPTLPFIGVHFTPKVDGSCWCGPTAMLAYKREGYKWNDYSVRDVFDMVAFKGLWIFIHKYFGYCLHEMKRSVSRKIIHKELQEYYPSLKIDDITPGAAAGVQAQAMNENGTFADDFRINGDGRILHCRNMPSPACTSSIAISRYLADIVEKRL